jgi:hypothetical protein
VERLADLLGAHDEPPFGLEARLLRRWRELRQLSARDGVAYHLVDASGLHRREVPQAT